MADSYDRNSAAALPTPLVEDRAFIFRSSSNLISRCRCSCEISALNWDSDMVVVVYVVTSTDRRNIQVDVGGAVVVLVPCGPCEWGGGEPLGGGGGESREIAAEVEVVGADPAVHGNGSGQRCCGRTKTSLFLPRLQDTRIRF